MEKLGTLLFIVLISVAGCNKAEQLQNDSETCAASAGFAPIADKVTATQGIFGIVSFTEGSCMPAAGGSSSCRTCPVRRAVQVYEYTSTADAVPHDGSNTFFTRFTTRLVLETNSDANGFFQCTLPPGRYSLVVVEKGLLYANLSDGQGGINPIIVETGVKQVDFSITYKAAF